MKLHRLVFTLLAAAFLFGVALVGQTTETTGAKMTDAAQKFLSTLKDDQKAQATFKFDDPERTNWFFIPVEDTKTKTPGRKGLRFELMNEDQKKAALKLLETGTSAEGYKKATTIMSLEAILKELETDPKFTRSPGWYFVTIFGTPSKTDKWGWRIEGHHLALNFTIDKGKIIGATPAFFGANPAKVKNGDRKGQRTLPEAEDLAFDLFKSLDADQKKVVLQPKLHEEIEQGKPKPNVGEPKGLPASKMSDKQKATLVKLLEAYTARMPGDIGTMEMAQVKDAGIDKVHFAFAGEAEEGKKHTYTIQGPTFVVEFLNTQEDGAKNPANHIHSCWRNLAGDFGLAK